MNRIKPCLSQALIHLTLVGAVCAPASVLAGTTAARADVTASSHAHHAQEGADRYRTHLQVHPAPAPAGQPVTLTLTVRDGEGRAVSRLTPSHEKPMHLFVVSKDLRHFAHVHPSLAGDSFRVQHTFAAAGEYTLFVDYQQPGRGQVVDRNSVHVEGAALPAAAALTESPNGQDFVHVHALDTRGSASRVSAHEVFPRSGLYKLWAQVQRHGGVTTVPFFVRVDGA